MTIIHRDSCSLFAADSRIRSHGCTCDIGQPTAAADKLKRIAQLLGQTPEHGTIDSESDLAAVREAYLLAKPWQVYRPVTDTTVTTDSEDSVPDKFRPYGSNPGVGYFDGW